MVDNNINVRIVELALKRALNGYTWNDIAETINNEFGTRLNADSCRKRASRYTTDTDSYIDNIDDFSENNTNNTYTEFDENDPRYLPTQLRDERNQANAIFRRLSRENSLKYIAQEAITELVKTKPLFSTDRMCSFNTSNEALLIISDWHYGVEINNYMNVYNPDICRKRVVELATNVIEKIKEKKISKLHVLNLGDMIAGIIHLQLRINSRLDVMSQAMQVSEILAEFLYELSKYVTIEYYQVLDNHSRIDPNKKEAMNLESLARITPWFLKERFSHINTPYHKITINDNEIDDDIASFFVADEFLVVGVHGDDDKQATMIQNLSLFTKEKPDLVCSAHLHHATIDEQCRTVRIANGSLMGTDDYAFQKRLDSRPSQTLVTFKVIPDETLDIDGIYKLNSYIFS